MQPTSTASIWARDARALGSTCEPASCTDGALSGSHSVGETVALQRQQNQGKKSEYDAYADHDLAHTVEAQSPAAPSHRGWPHRRVRQLMISIEWPPHCGAGSVEVAMQLSLGIRLPHDKLHAGVVSIKTLRRPYQIERDRL